MKPVSLTYPTAQTLYAFPDNLSLATWATNRVQLIEPAAPNLCRYTANLNETTGALWRYFSGASQPASWDYSLGFFLIGDASNIVSTVYTPGTTLYAYPDNASLADYTTVGVTQRIQLVEQAAPNAGRYVATLSAVTAPLWRVFIGASQPANWDLAIEAFDLTDLAPLANAARVTFRASEGIIGKQLRLHVTSSLIGRNDDRAFSQTAYESQTEIDGTLELDLPWSSNPGVGKYRFRLYDAIGRVVHDREAAVPDVPAIEYADLV